MLNKPADYDAARDGIASFSFDDDVSYPCKPSGTWWNGFDNVRVSPQVLALIIADIEACELPIDRATIDDLQAIPPDADGLIDLGYCYATSLDDPVEIWPEPKRALISLSAADASLVADAISNSDMPSDDRLRLLDVFQ